MSKPSISKSRLLDRVAISMAVICAIHCLITPVLLVALPILATTFWVDSNFHLWMLLLVLPTTSLAIWAGCRKHKDRWVIASAAIGLSILTTSLIIERSAYSQSTEPLAASQQEGILIAALDSEATTVEEKATPTGWTCSCCGSPASESGDDSNLVIAGISWIALFNTLGGCFLIAGHTRNFMLCRKMKCRCHGADGSADCSHPAA